MTTETPHIYVPHSIDWRYDDVLKFYVLTCTDCSATVHRVGASWAMSWANEHRCPGYCEHVLVPSQYPGPCHACRDAGLMCFWCGAQFTDYRAYLRHAASEINVTPDPGIRAWVGGQS